MILVRNEWIIVKRVILKKGRIVVFDGRYYYVFLFIKIYLYCCVINMNLLI